MIDQLEELVRGYVVFRVLAGVDILLMSLKTLKFGRDHQRVRVFIMMVWEAAIDLGYFLGIAMLLLVGFSTCAHCVLGSTMAGFSTVPEALQLTLNMLIGRFEHEPFVTDEQQAMLVFFYVFNVRSPPPSILVA